MRIAAITHVPFETAAHVAVWASRRGHTFNEVATCDRVPLPGADDFDWLVVMGGPMSVHDEKRFPWLVDEKRLIGTAIADGRLVVGICLGSQLVASVLGAEVRPLGHLEVGWWPVELTSRAAGSVLFGGLPAPPEVFHWHGETFDLPAGAVHIARSEACENQAFTWGDRVVGLQFHPEMTPDGAEALAIHCPGDPGSGRWAQPALELVAHSGRFQLPNGWLDGLLERMETTWKTLTSA